MLMSQVCDGVGVCAFCVRMCWFVSSLGELADGLPTPAVGGAPVSS